MGSRFSFLVSIRTNRERMGYCSCMRMPSRRAMAHALGALVLAATAVVAVGTPSHADSTPKPEIFSGKATASSFLFFFDRTPGLLPITDIFHVEVPYATSVLTSSGDISATSAAIFPGSGVVGGPALLCGQFVPCGFTPPAYPAIAISSYPSNPDAKAETSLDSANVGGILHIDPSVSKAHSDPDDVDARTTAATATVLDLAGADSMTTRSHQYFKNGALVTEALSDVKGFSLLNGFLHIDSISSIASSVVGSGTTPSAALHTTIAGATLAGTPVVIDETGIHVSTQGDSGAAKDNVNTALAQLAAAGIHVKLASPAQTITKNGVNASTSGLFIGIASTLPDVPLPIPPLPLPVAPPTTGGDYVGSITVAGAGISTYAAGLAVGTTPGLGNGAVDPGAGAGSTPVGDPSLGEALPSGPSLVTSPSGTGVEPTAIAPRASAGSAKDDTAARIKVLALALIAYPALVLLFRIFSALFGGALGAPSRLPRARA